MNRIMTVIVLSFLSSACMNDTAESTHQNASKPEANQANQQTDEKQKMITVTGTIVYKQLEGGFWGLDAHDGKKYMPSGIDKSLMKDGMVVEVKGHILEDVMTFQQYGQSLKVVESKMIDASKVKPDPNAY